jgi:hypothetical protein
VPLGLAAGGAIEPPRYDDGKMGPWGHGDIGDMKTLLTREKWTLKL